MRFLRCEVQSQECALPRKRSRMTIPSQPVTPPAFSLPVVLPEGLAQSIVEGARCRGSWLGVAGATVDQAGRITTLDLAPVSTSPAWRRALDTLLRLSLADNMSLRSSFSGPILLAHADRSTLCLDEPLPQVGAMSTYRVGGAVQPPKVKKRVEPIFPESARESMGPNRTTMVIVESVISSTGCVRSIRLVEQSPYAALNGAAVMALSQWTFTPGYLDRKPVDVLFNLTVNFKNGQ
ncbi:MAG TPA: energy transducer TonB [Thermoanaerobaculia bacterium]|nr:energy transducer TonB [Thermoanaerobaculia bacterium]